MAENIHPVLTFQVNLEVNNTEAVGPNTNLVNPHILHPMRHQDDQDNAIAEKNNIRNTRGIYLPGLNGGANVAGMMGDTANKTLLAHGDRFTMRGAKAHYLRTRYTNGVLQDLSSEPLILWSETPADALDV